MWNKPNEKRLANIPRIGANDKKRTSLGDIPIHLHFFIGGCDWYIAEYDQHDIFFGFAILHDDKINAEWGYISFKELKSISINGMFEIDCENEQWFPIQAAKEIEKIANCPYGII
jgi:hypothetical protein